MSEENLNRKRLKRGLVANIIFLVALVVATGWYAISLQEEDAGNDKGWSEVRDLTTPSGRLVGHWEFVSEVAGDRIKFYFGPQKQGKGITYLVQPNGNTTRWEYRIVKEARSGWQISIECLNPGGKVVREVDLTIPNSGRTAEYEYVYFDRKQEREMVFKGIETEPSQPTAAAPTALP